MLYRTLVCSICILLQHSCSGCEDCDKPPVVEKKKCDISEFGFPETVAETTENPISGLAASRKHKGYLYTVSDDSNSNIVNVINAIDGSTVGHITIDGAVNVDWEEATVGVCQHDTSKTCLYILDAGDNADVPANCIYVMEEPDEIIGEHTIGFDLKIDFSGWEADGDDCCTETLFMDPEGNLYFFSRAYQGMKVSLYKLVNVDGWKAVKQTTVNLPSTNTGPDSADLNPSGDELLVRFHDMVYHFCIKDGDIKGALQRFCSLPFTPHPCGTSVAWAADEGGFYTSTEGATPPLRFSDRYADKECSKQGVESPTFNFGQVVGFVDEESINEEVTGIAFSRDHPDYIYLITDGTSADTLIHVIQASNGFYVSKITLTGVTNVDWQDIVVGQLAPLGPNYIMILDAGALNGGPARKIITLPEPGDLQTDQTINVAAEAIIEYDTTAGVSHAMGLSSYGKIYILDYQSDYENVVTMFELVDTGAALRVPTPVGNFLHRSNYRGPESMSIAPDGAFLLIKNLDSVWVYSVIQNNFQTTLANVQPLRAAYTAENRGLSITICPHSSSYYTLSSKRPYKLRGYSLLQGCAKPDSYFVY